MDCDTYHELIVADLDDTLSASERETVRAHLDRCAVCRNARALEAEFVAHLRRIPRLVETPAAVQERLRAALRRETAAPARAPGPRPLTLAAGAVVLALVALALLWPPGVDPLGAVADDYHLAEAAHLPLDVATGDPAVLARYFDGSGRFAFPASVFDLRRAGYRLLGGAIRVRHGVVFAVSVYERDGQIVVCHRFRDLERRPGSAVAERRYAWSGDLGTWIMRRGGVVCCVTGRGAPEELERVVGAVA